MVERKKEEEEKTMSYNCLTAEMDHLLKRAQLW